MTDLMGKTIYDIDGQKITHTFIIECLISVHAVILTLEYFSNHEITAIAITDTIVIQILAVYGADSATK